jgi:hypothetical protein
LSERNVVKENKIKCKKCNEEFVVKGKQFKSNHDLRKLLERSESYLSKDESSLKKLLEDSMRKSFQFYDEFNQNKSILESNVYDHFQEMRFQVDEQREELKKKIDDIALTMIDKIKKSEAMFLKNLKKKFQENFSSFVKSKPFVAELNEIEELFRSPNLLIESIREMQRKQEESLNEFQLKLNEMNQVKEFCEETNGFQPNLSAFNQEDLFGSLKVNELCSNTNSLMSQILKGEQQYFELLKLCEFAPTDKWSLLYRGTRDGFGSDDFHSKCDSHSSTLTLLKAKGSSFIFGGYTTALGNHLPEVDGNQMQMRLYSVSQTKTINH